MWSGVPATRPASTSTTCCDFISNLLSVQCSGPVIEPGRVGSGSSVLPCSTEEQNRGTRSACQYLFGSFCSPYAVNIAKPQRNIDLRPREDLRSTRLIQ